MLGGVKMCGAVASWRLIAAADVTAGAAKPQMDPVRSRLEAFLAPERLGRYIDDIGEVFAVVTHAVDSGSRAGDAAST